MKTNPGNNPKYEIKVLQKAFRLIELFDEHSTELSIAEIADRLHYSQTTVFRIISNLEAEGYLDKDSESGKYSLGMKLFFLGTLINPHEKLLSIARPLLRRLNQESEETVHFAVLHKNQALYLDKIESRQTVRVAASRIGHKLHAHCSGVGKVLLAYLPTQEAKTAVEKTGLPSFTSNTITTWEHLSEALEQIHKQGFAIDDEEIEIGLNCVAAPVFFDGRAVAAISLSVPKDRFKKNVKALTSMVVQAAGAVSDALQRSIKVSTT